MGFITLARFCNNSDYRYIGSTISRERLLRLTVCGMTFEVCVGQK